MGIPKFFRWISERYPLTSQLIQENNIPEFDNLYLDFNGIIHNCTHPNDEDASFRLSEEQMFTAIFAYIEHLFGKIKPKKVFFLAVDGPAPRAKMNQQRSRRFKTAKEAKEVKEKAEKKGEPLPETKAFDSNCITPGTQFMALLSTQIQYFINKKISEDSNWRQVQVILSGHEVPGEGEHKIMEYIRLSKAQKDYDPNTRHCLYGLDADLIMLGLLSHDPHFCLLREEVKFGPQSKKKSGGLETQNFFLLHLCLFREYLNLEFQPLWNPSMGMIDASTSVASKTPHGNNANTDTSVLPFNYSLERIIDDFILLAVFVGNDFLPNLPDLHIHDNALETIFDIYRRVLPAAGGYLNESGVINVQRLQLVLNELAGWERDAFEKEHSDMNWFKGKTRGGAKEIEERITKGANSMTQEQQQMFKSIKTFLLNARKHKPESTQDEEGVNKLSFVNEFPARDRAFLTKVAAELHVSLTWDEYDDQDRNLATLRIPSSSSTHADDESSEDDGGDEGRAAVDRVLKKYEKLTILEDEGDADERHEVTMQKKMEEWKRNYYKEKLGFAPGDEKAVETFAYRYVEGLQWVMFYYYSGVASWGWFYDYHYAPRITDLKDVDKMKFDFKLGTPFMPFEQLMGVLPEASKELIPPAYRELMYDPTSPILDFYPQDFVSDMNGKKAEWEAIVKIPFIQEDRLLKAMRAREHLLTKEERQRNHHGNSLQFVYDPNNVTVYPSPLPGFFPDIHKCMCITKPFNLPTLDGLHLVKGLLDGVGLGVHAMAGFPSLDNLPHTAQLLYHSVNVFKADSRNQSMVLYIKNQWADEKILTLAEQLIGNRAFYNWPFLQEGMVVALSDSHFTYEMQAFGNAFRVAPTEHNQNGLGQFSRKAEGHESRYSKRFGVISGDVDVLIHVRPLKGLKRLDDGSLVKEWELEDKETDFPLQMAVLQVNFEDERFKEQPAPPLEEEFPTGTTVFFLGDHAYGVVAQVQSIENNFMSVTLAFFPGEKAENDQFTQLVLASPTPDYYASYNVAQMLRMTGLAVSKITSSLMVLLNEGSKVNVGLSLKFHGRGLKVLNYTRMDDRGWEYSAQAVELLREYKAAFPLLFSKLDNRGDAMVQASDIFPGPDADAKVKEIRVWLNEKGVKDFEAVPLTTQALDKNVIKEIEKLANDFTANRSTTAIKKARVERIPRRAVLKPSHAASFLHDQVFRLGDRVTMVQDSGGVPLCAKGIVVGLVEGMIDVVWDIAFIGGTKLGGRCSEYRGSTCTTNSCLNLTLRQHIASTGPTRNEPSTPVHLAKAMRPRGNMNGYTSFSATPGPNQQRGGAPFAGSRGQAPPTRILANPSRGRGGYRSAPNGSPANSAPPSHSATPPPAVNLFQVHANAQRGRGRGAARATAVIPLRGGTIQGRGRGGHQTSAPSQTHANSTSSVNRNANNTTAPSTNGQHVQSRAPNPSNPGTLGQTSPLPQSQPSLLDQIARHASNPNQNKNNATVQSQPPQPAQTNALLQLLQGAAQDQTQIQSQSVPVLSDPPSTTTLEAGSPPNGNYAAPSNNDSKRGQRGGPGNRGRASRGGHRGRGSGAGRANGQGPPNGNAHNRAKSPGTAQS